MPDPNNPPWPRINPALLRKWIEVQYLPDTVTSIGEQTPVWTTLLRTRAMVAVYKGNPDGREFESQGLVSARATRVITIRWPRNKQITSGMRVMLVDQAYSPPAIHYYNVEWTNNIDNRNILLEIICWDVNAVG